MFWRGNEVQVVTDNVANFKAIKMLFMQKSKAVIIVGNPSVSLRPTLSKNEKVEHHIRMKTHKPIVLRFWVMSGVNPLYVSQAHVSLVLYLPSDLLSKDLRVVSELKVRVVTNLDEALYQKSS